MINNKGFSLTELMIVVSVIGILASTAIPGTVKIRDSIKEQSVMSNITMIRGYLELHASSKSDNNLEELKELMKDLGELEHSDLSSEHIFANPFTKGTRIVTGTTSSLDEDVSVVVYTENGFFDGDFTGGIDAGNDASKGKVYIQIYDNAYVIWGRDRNGETIQYQVIQ